ncbi:MAG: ATP-dependent helicase [Bacilli bacterium]|nr:ATP-dependent helicase [Bacilli bacterium]
MYNNLLHNLNNDQYHAVTIKSKYTLVLASPGSGKTSVLTRRIGYLLNNGVKENEIVAFTFTKKAAWVMKTRVEKMLESTSIDSISTFHSYCFLYLKTYNFDIHYIIIDEEEINHILASIIEKYNLHKTIQDAVKLITSVKNNMEVFAPTYFEQKENLILYYEYEKYLESQDKIDFDDMNLKMLNLLKTDRKFKELVTNNLKHILVDECQDLNRIQYEIIKEISDNSNIYMVGDPDQAIYEWRGSDIKILESFINKYSPTVIYLNKNYRSYSNIIESSNELISKNEFRFEKHSIPTKSGGIIYYDNFNNEKTVSDFIINIIKDNPNKTVFILFRNHNLSLIYEKCLKENNIDYAIKGKPFYEYSEIKLILAYYRLLFNSNDEEALNRVLTFPKRGIGEVTISSLIITARFNGNSLYNEFKNSDKECCVNFYNEIEHLKALFKITKPTDFFKILMDYIHINEFIDYDPEKEMRIHYIKESLDIESTNYIDDTYNILSNLFLDKDKELKQSNITLMTMHQSKGLEADIVFIVDAMEGIIPSLKKERQKDIEQERKVFYVSMTRAREKLYILSSSNRYIKGLNKRYIPSRFIIDAGLMKEVK